jgi:iron complex transport system ATP-binding protein
MGLWAKHISFSFPRAKKPLLRDVSFRAEDSELTVLIGANGVGKTTLLKTILGLQKGGGTVEIGGMDRETMTRRELSRRVGYMPQESALVSSLRVFEVVLLGRMESLRLKVSDEDVAQVWEILRLLRLEHLAEQPFYALSGGQRRMVGIAQTMVREPEVLVLDEPTANLDMQHELKVLELLRAYAEQRNVAVLLTLHDLNMAAQYADKLVLLKDGEVYRQGTPSFVMTKETIENTYHVQVHIENDSSGVPVLRPIRTLHGEEYRFTE